MATQIIEVPVDFGLTESGVYKPSGLRIAPRLLHEIVRNKLPNLNVTEAQITVTHPQENSSSDNFLKFDDELSLTYETAVISLLAGGTNHFPIFLGGDHTTSLLTASLATSQLMPNAKLGAIVFDAHTDFNRPGPIAKFRSKIPLGHTLSGNAHGMIHALIGGLVDSKYRLARFCKRHVKVDPSRIVLIGTRTKTYPSLAEVLNAVSPLIIDSNSIHNASDDQLARLANMALDRATSSGREPFYLSFDFDVLDPAIFPWVSSPVEGGLTSEEASKMMLFIQQLLRPSLLLAIDLVEFSPKKASDTMPVTSHIVQSLLGLIASDQRCRGK